MPLSELPPTDLVVEKLKFAVLPAGAAAGAVFGLGLLLAWLLSPRWRAIAPSLAVLALAAGVATAPLLKSWNDARIDAAKAAGDTERVAALAAAYPFERAFPWVPDGKWWHWGWYAIGLALLVELLARLPGVGVGVGHLLRGVAAGVIAAVLVLPRFLLKSDKLPPAVFEPEALWQLISAAGLMAGQWAVVDAVGRRNPGGGVAAAVAVACAGAAAVLIHDAAAGFTDMSTYLMVGLGVLAVFGWITRTDVGSAGAVATVPVASLAFAKV